MSGSTRYLNRSGVPGDYWAQFSARSDSSRLRIGGGFKGNASVLVGCIFP